MAFLQIFVSQQLLFLFSKHLDTISNVTDCGTGGTDLCSSVNASCLASQWAHLRPQYLWRMSKFFNGKLVIIYYVFLLYFLFIDWVRFCNYGSPINFHIEHCVLYWPFCRRFYDWLLDSVSKCIILMMSDRPISIV